MRPVTITLTTHRLRSARSSVPGGSSIDRAKALRFDVTCRAAAASASPASRRTRLSSACSVGRIEHCRRRRARCAATIQGIRRSRRRQELTAEDATDQHRHRPAMIALPSAGRRPSIADRRSAMSLIAGAPACTFRRRRLGPNRSCGERQISARAASFASQIGRQRGHPSSSPSRSAGASARQDSASPDGRAWAGARPAPARIEPDDRLAGRVARTSKPRMVWRAAMPVLDDPVERAADQLVGALRPEAGHDRHHAVRRAALCRRCSAVEARAADRDLAHVEGRHARQLANYASLDQRA